MGRPKGTTKTGGRKKGTPNKKTQILSDYLSNLKFDAPKEIIELLPKLEPDKQADVLLKLMEYIYPKRRAVDVKSDSMAQSFAELVSSIESN